MRISQVWFELSTSLGPIGERTKNYKGTINREYRARKCDEATLRNERTPVNRKRSTRKAYEAELDRAFQTSAPVRTDYSYEDYVNLKNRLQKNRSKTRQSFMTN